MPFVASATGPSHTLPVPAGVASGDVLLASFIMGGTWTVSSVPAGWTLVRSTSSGAAGPNRLLVTYVRSAGGSEPASYSWTFSGGTANGVMTAWRGVYLPVEVSDGAAQVNSAGTVPAPSITTTSQGALLVMIGAVSTSSALSFSPPAGMTERVDTAALPATEAYVVADETQSSPGATGARNASVNLDGDTNDAVGQLLAFTTNLAPNAPTLVSPVGGVSIDLAAIQRFSWTFSDPDSGDTQSKFDLRYRPAAGGTWTDVTGTTPNSFYDLPASTLTAGDYEWQARTYDAQGVVGPYSSSGFFTAATVSNDITITAPTNGATISTETFTVTWSTPTQTHYQLRVVADLAGAPDPANVIYDTGEIASSSARSRQVSYPDNGVTRHTQVRKKQDGLWSDWASVSNPVSFTTPAVPTITVDDTSQPGAIQVQATHPTPTGSEPTVSHMDVWRRRAKVDANGTFVEWYDTERDPGGENGFAHRDGSQLAPTAIFTDWFVNGGGYSYRVRDVGANETSSYSEWSDDGSGEVVNEIDGGAPDTVYDDELDGGGP